MQAIGWNPALHLNIDNIGPAMKELGFPRKRYNSDRGYVVCRYSDMEITAQKYAKADHYLQIKTQQSYENRPLMKLHAYVQELFCRAKFTHVRKRFITIPVTVVTCH